MSLKVENPHWEKMQQEVVSYTNMQMNNFDTFSLIYLILMGKCVSRFELVIYNILCVHVFFFTYGQM
jgi:hypothetical protein